MSASSELLVIDAGHTRVKCATVLLPATDGPPLPEVVWHTAVMLEGSCDYSHVVTAVRQRGSVVRSILAGSNPQARTQFLEQWPAELVPIEVLDQNAKLPLEIQVDRPEKVGVDRLLNAIAANRLRGERQPAIIVDTGTAVTVDCVSSKGAFLGGTILPGVRMGAKALQRYTSTLPHVDAGSLFNHPPVPIGRNTEAAIESGLYWGHLGAVRELILRIRDELATFDPAKDSPVLLLITGGAAGLLRPHIRNARFEPHLALQGLAATALKLWGWGSR